MGRGEAGESRTVTDLTANFAARSGCKLTYVISAVCRKLSSLPEASHPVIHFLERVCAENLTPLQHEVASG